MQAWGKTMQSTHRTGAPTYQVMALFADAALTFGLARGATFADLADRVDQLGERHIGLPKAIYLKLRMARGLAAEPPLQLEPPVSRRRRLGRRGRGQNANQEDSIMPSRTIPDRKPTVDVAEYDLAKSRKEQLKHHGEEKSGKKDGYRTGNEAEVDGASPTG